MCSGGWQCLLSCVYRKKLRSKFGLPKEPCADCCVHCCFGPLALCQEYVELKHSGLDHSKGCIVTHTISLNHHHHNYFWLTSFSIVLGWVGPPNCPPTAPPQFPPLMYR